MVLNEKQKLLIKQSLLTAIQDNKMPMPEDIEIGRVYKTFYYKHDNRGCRDLRFKIIDDNKDGFLIDYYFLTDDYSVHRRINENNDIIDLENFEGQFGWPVLGTLEETEKEHSRIKEHNNKVLEILKKKGFEN